MVIKFRGKDKKSNWVYGNIVEVPNAAFVIKSVPWDFCRKDPENWKIIEYGNFEYSVVVYSVDHTTIGRFTGFKDINDKEIFEGDIIQNDYHEEEIYKIIMIGGCWCGLVSGGDIDDDDDTPTLGWLLDMAPFKVIGNIHDNPELLEGGKADD